MDRNFKHKEIVNITRIDILHLLYFEEKSLDDLKEQLKEIIQPSTLFKYLDIMEKDGMLKRILQVDRRKRNYKITSKGIAYLTKSDPEARQKAFSVFLFHLFDSYMHRLVHEKQSKEERKDALDTFSKIIGRAMLSLVIKNIEDNDAEALNLLNPLPHLLAMRFKAAGLPTAPIREALAMKVDSGAFIADNVLDALDSCYIASKKIDSETYKHVMSVFGHEDRMKIIDEVQKEKD